MVNIIQTRLYKKPQRLSDWAESQMSAHEVDLTQIRRFFASNQAVIFEVQSQPRRVRAHELRLK